MEAKNLWIKAVKDFEGRKAQILDILSRGNVVRFRLPDGSWKDVKEWNEDDVGDLEAFRSHNVATNYVCWLSSYYTIEEVLP